MMNGTLYVAKLTVAAWTHLQKAYQAAGDRYKTSNEDAGSTVYDKQQVMASTAGQRARKVQRLLRPGVLEKKGNDRYYERITS